MGKLKNAITQLHRLDDLAAGDSLLHRLPPAAKVLGLVLYLLALLSFSRYAVLGTLCMGAPLLVLYPLGRVSLAGSLKNFRHVLLLLAGIGLLNALVTPNRFVLIGPWMLPGSFVIFCVLLFRGIFSCLGVYGLLATTSMEEICAALRALHIPRILVGTLLLLYRYLILLLQEGERMSTAYALRVPQQKGIPKKVWGSFLGLWFLRSLDRAERVYEAMELRGFHDIRSQKHVTQKQKRQGLGLVIALGLYGGLLHFLGG